ncbi:MAG: hypothetical protein H0W87_10195 [Actinobacteria bacterium]|nr:hypothetical protein [Actinomycetota bacterium]
MPEERKAPAGLIWGVAAVIVVALAAGGYFVGHSGGSTKTTPDTKGALSAGGASVAIPAGWHELETVPKIPYLPLQDAKAMAPDASSGLVLGTANLTYPYNLPLTLIGHESAQTRTSYNQRPYLVDIGGLQAWRTSGVSFSASGKPLYTFIYFPQGKNATTTAVCYSKTGSVSALLDCEKAASGIKISGGKVYDLVPSASYASSLSADLNALWKTRATGYQTMKTAKSPGVQAKAAQLVGKAYTVTASAIKKLKPPPYAQLANKKIAAALTSAAGAYNRLGSAAAAKSSSRYAAASKQVASAERALTNAVLDLKSLGYNVG